MMAIRPSCSQMHIQAAAACTASVTAFLTGLTVHNRSTQAPTLKCKRSEKNVCLYLGQLTLPPSTTHTHWTGPGQSSGLYSYRHVFGWCGQQHAAVPSRTSFAQGSLDQPMLPSGTPRLFIRTCVCAFRLLCSWREAPWPLSEAGAGLELQFRLIWHPQRSVGASHGTCQLRGPTT